MTKPCTHTGRGDTNGGGNDGSFIPITLAAPLLLIYVRFKGTRYLFVILEAVLAWKFST